jgi:hypothetical protein
MQTEEIQPIIINETPNPLNPDECKNIGNMGNEIWKDIKGYEGFYQVSNLGNVKSLDRKTLYQYKWIKGKILKPSDNKGYLRVCLQKNSDKSWKYIQRLVGEAFIPNPNNLPEINHKNLIKSDNYVENLEWSTKQDNMDHAVRNGVILSGENANTAKLTWDKVRIIREWYLEDKSSTGRGLGKIFGVSKHAINSLLKNEFWYDEEYQKIVDSQVFRDRLKTATCKGELQGRSKLKTWQVLEIRIRHSQGEGPTDLADEFNVSKGHIGMIVRRKTWKHI